jgi:hypothetical protein
LYGGKKFSDDEIESAIEWAVFNASYNTNWAIVHKISKKDEITTLHLVSTVKGYPYKININPENIDNRLGYIAIPEDIDIPMKAKRFNVKRINSSSNIGYLDKVDGLTVEQYRKDLKSDLEIKTRKTLEILEGFQSVNFLKVGDYFIENGRTYKITGSNNTTFTIVDISQIENSVTNQYEVFKSNINAEYVMIESDFQIFPKNLIHNVLGNQNSTEKVNKDFITVDDSIRSGHAYYKVMNVYRS